jgi:bifunctional non-homologous end joining protein LigD
MASRGEAVSGMAGLSTYRRKRDFKTTPEPKGGVRKKKGWMYVIQKHAASHLHYDFRLELDGVLKSWAVPKGPSLDPSVKRLAMHVEDHPIEYGSFEGTIPEGEYGGGTVMLWDRGTWEQEDAAAGYRSGKLHFTLHGEKLRGEWVLVRRGGQQQSGKEIWLLFKVRDAEARPNGPDILESEPLSVKTGRDMDAIAAGKRVWRSNRKAAPKRASEDTQIRKTEANRRQARQSLRGLLKALPKSADAALPRKIEPQLATLVKEAPEGSDWFSEIKFDGYRMICRIDKRDVKLSSRNQLDWTSRLEPVVKAVRGLGVESAILDGEVVVQQPDGVTSFQALQNAFSEGRQGELIYYVFDLLYLNGKSLFKLPLEERKRLLASLLGGSSGILRYSEHVEGNAAAFFRQACKHKLEGIICKRRDRSYRAGRSTDWLKVKCSHREEFVIGGFTPPEGARRGFGAVLVGYYDRQHRLQYAGRVGTGYSDRLLVELSRRLKSMEQEESPFANLKGRTGQARGVHWVKPELVAQVEFSEWTRDNSLRHPSFQGLREDKAAKEVVLERAVDVEQVPHATNSSNGKKASGRKSATRKSTTMKAGKKAAANDSQILEFLAGVSLPAGVRLTHPDKVIFPDAGLTKAHLAGYYSTVADWILPQLVGRPLVLVRCPEGAGAECFYQKHARVGTPEVLRRVRIVEKNKTLDYVSVDNLEALLSLVQMNALEIHVWGARNDNIELPDRLVFDLDPDPSVAWPRVVESAQQMRAFFEDLGLKTFLKTSGGKGLHIMVPVERRLDWDETKEACQQIAAAIVRADPARYTANMSKAARTNKIYVDFLRNARGATSVAAYSTRARGAAPVSMPITWEELPDIEGPDRFTLARAVERLAKLKKDPWKDIGKIRQSISKTVLKRLGQ